MPRCCKSRQKILFTYYYLESPEQPGLLIDGANETLKHKTKKQKGGFPGAVKAPITPSLILPIVSWLWLLHWEMLLAGKGQEDLFLPLLALPLMVKVMELEKQGRDIIT